MFDLDVKNSTNFDTICSSLTLIIITNKAYLQLVILTQIQDDSEISNKHQECQR
jgi:hypothetical protein